MKKILRIGLAAMLIAVSVFTFTACSGKDDAAYLLVHGHYIGKAVVTVDKKGNITDLEIEEVEMPYSWAAVVDGKIDGVAIQASDTVTFEMIVKGAPAEVTYAKKVKIGNLVFTMPEEPGSAEDYALDVNSYSTSIGVYAQLNGAWFYEQMEAGEYYVLKADETAYDIAFTKEAGPNNEALKKGDRWFKSKNGYWAGDYPLGWKGNIEKLKDFYVGKGTALGLGVPARGGKIGEVETGATLIDYPDYHNLIVLAYAKATK